MHISKYNKVQVVMMCMVSHYFCRDVTRCRDAREDSCGSEIQKQSRTAQLNRSWHKLASFQLI